MEHAAQSEIPAGRNNQIEVVNAWSTHAMPAEMPDSIMQMPTLLVQSLRPPQLTFRCC